MNADLYNILLVLHSIGRWIVLLLLVIAIFNSAIANNRPFIKSDNKTGLMLTIFTDLMLVIGIALWFFGAWGYQQIQQNGMGEVMKNSTMRFFAVEHMVGMLIATILIHIGKAQARKPIGDKAKHRRTVTYYIIALIVILLSIPWPFREIGEGRGWF